MGILKIGLIQQKTVVTTYGYLEIDTDQYEELSGKSEEEIKTYLNENMFEFELSDEDSDYGSIYDHLTNEGDELHVKEIGDSHEASSI